ncbi:hypothetical protein QCM77_37200 [Bradyrhizobium sp. SSUT18]|uniref:hypothetical protein n=1 Tax=unclassified Bradyrhizobium TaxID=2631580 RepID=UPI002447145D|nr:MULTISPECIES: hypothetical protein [unclassified Bradyrhizobium]MDH2347074.1 hypothetical protein [Bradyrhizobium sp. SSUT77]MDH2405490.1 hypothetical protein [Bradyrhizobium sp. SSUT18]
MARTAILRKDLELVALQEIRSFPGGEHVVSVEIECGAEEDRDMGWRLHVIAKDEAELGRINYAAKSTTERLKRRYCLKW